MCTMHVVKPLQVSFFYTCFFSGSLLRIFFVLCDVIARGCLCVWFSVCLFVRLFFFFDFFIVVFAVCLMPNVFICV